MFAAITRRSSSADKESTDVIVGGTYLAKSFIISGHYSGLS
jgi:hypothetical protein